MSTPAQLPWERGESSHVFINRAVELSSVGVKPCDLVSVTMLCLAIFCRLHVSRRLVGASGCRGFSWRCIGFSTLRGRSARLDQALGLGGELLYLSLSNVLCVAFKLFGFESWATSPTCESVCVCVLVYVSMCGADCVLERLWVPA